MLNTKTKFDTFQILGKEEFSKRTNTLSWEGCEHAKILTKSTSSNQIYAVHFDKQNQSKGVTGSTHVKFWGRR